MASLTLKKAKRPERPRLLVALYGPSMGGKTLLTTQLPGSILLFDPGGRYLEQAGHRDDIYEVYETAKENTRIQNITKALAEVMPKSGGDIENIVVDDFTFAFQALIDEVESMPATGPGSRETKGHKAKVMKALRRELFGYGKNVVIIYHTHMGGDGRSDEIVERKTMSDIEIGRTDMFTNLTLRVVIDQKSGKHGVLIERNRFGHAGITVWDDSGNWDGFWEKLQTEAYKGLSWDDMRKIASSVPTTFADRPAAWAWGMEQGCFKDIAHAANAMEKLSREYELLDGDDLWTAWVADVQRRKQEVVSTSFSDGDQAMAWGVSMGAFPDLVASKAAYTALRTEKKPANAKEMFSLWIALVQSLLDTPQPEEPIIAEDTQAEQPPLTEEDAPVAHEQSVDVQQVAKPAPKPKEEPLEWMRNLLPDEAKPLIEEVRAAGSDQRVSPAQAAGLAKVVTEIAGWNGEASDKLFGLTRVDWTADLLGGTTGGDVTVFPQGSYGVLIRKIAPKLGKKTNEEYSELAANIVKTVAGIVDQAFNAYL